MNKKHKLTFIDLFSGIGGFHLALHKLGLKCVFASEIDEIARKSYQENFKKISPNIFERNLFNKDIYLQDKKKFLILTYFVVGSLANPLVK